MGWFSKKEEKPAEHPNQHLVRRYNEQAVLVAAQVLIYRKHKHGDAISKEAGEEMKKDSTRSLHDLILREGDWNKAKAAYLQSLGLTEAQIALK